MEQFVIVIVILLLLLVLIYCWLTRQTTANLNVSKNDSWISLPDVRNMIEKNGSTKNSVPLTLPIEIEIDWFNK